MRIEGKSLEPHPDLASTVVPVPMSVVHMPMPIIGALLGVATKVRRIVSILRIKIGGARGIAGWEPVLLLLLL